MRKTDNAQALQGVSASLTELIGLKAKAEKLAFPLRHRSRSQFYGAKRSALRGRGLDFDEVRAYQAGDEIRSIDWRVTARTGEAHTKIYKEEKEKPVFVLLDLRSPMFFGSRTYFKSVSACHVAALLAWASVKRGDRFGALIFSEQQEKDLKPRTGNKAALNFVQIASQYSEALLTHNGKKNITGAQAAFTLNNALEKLYQIIRPGSLIYLISDFHDLNENSQQFLTLLSRHNDLIAIHVHDALEQQLPHAGRLLFTNTHASAEHISEIQANNKHIRQQYQQYFSDKSRAHIELLLNCRVHNIAINTEQEVFEQLQQHSFQRRFKRT